MRPACWPRPAVTSATAPDTLRWTLNRAVFEHIYITDDEVVGSDLALPSKAAVGAAGRRLGAGAGDRAQQGRGHHFN